MVKLFIVQQVGDFRRWSFLLNFGSKGKKGRWQGKNMNIFCTADQAGFVLIHALLCLYINQNQAIDDVR